MEIIRAVETDDALREAGDAAMRAIGTVPLYARADFVRADGSLNSVRERGFHAALPSQPTALNRSTLWLMELELIEPSLYLRMDKGAPERFARALHDRVLLEKGNVKI